MKSHDQQCTSRKQDWKDLLEVIRSRGRVGHELKNILVEEWRRISGKCPPEADGHEP